jgi:hypothetical protein
MSDLGQPPVPLPPTTTDTRSSSEIPLWLVAGLVLLMVLGGGVAAWALTHQETQKQSGPSYPKTWDPRIAPYVKAVEKQRGLTFLHPVAVRFLSDQDFEKTVTTDEKKLDDKDRKEIAQFTGLMRAIGLIAGDVDLFAAFNQAHGSGTLAYYSFEDQRITVRGATLVPGARATLVHELTHALEDQRFGLGKRYDALRKSKADSAATEESILDGISEGDASRVADLYKASLPAKQRRIVEKGEKKDADQANATLRKVPKVVLTIISSPYALGEALVATVAADGGNSAVDQLLRDSPTHESVLLDPFRQLLGDAGSGKVAKPELAKGEKEFDAGEFGAPQWYLMLAERMPLQTALAAADGWGADSYVAFDRGGTTCVRANYAGQSNRDTVTMYAALRRWANQSTSSTATVTRNAGSVGFESCDPGTSAKGGRDASIDALTLATTRNFIGAALVKQGAPARIAQCVAGKFIGAFSIAQLSDPKFGADDPAVKSRVLGMVAACRS